MNLSKWRLQKTLALGAILVAISGPSRAADEKPVLIGEINSYAPLPQFTGPYRNGWQLAVEEANASRGPNDRLIQVTSRDDNGKPDEAILIANEMLNNQKIDVLTGGFLSHIGLAMSDFALRNKLVFVAAQPMTDALVWEKGNRYTFRVTPSTNMQIMMLVDQAAKMPAKRWATIANNYEFGQVAVASFKAQLKAQRPDVEFVGEQWPALGKLEAGSTVQALSAIKPDAIFSMLFGAELNRFVREGNQRDLFKGREVINLQTGCPEFLDALKAETPKGWIVTGYPWEQIKTPEHVAFVDVYRKKYNDYPRCGSIIGYTTMKAIIAGIRKAGSTDPEQLIPALRGISIISPFGPVSFRPQDQQLTLGTYVGRLDMKNGAGLMVDWVYSDGKNFQPPDDFVKSKRPVEATR
ncbi:ABC transporter substrate-binding protein [Bradyrhizobiaceae bacterium SG-6C]|nr:ABC transporter substrate-binding protein [Bradyrhizobiaceae bacterium SG-6C]